MVYCTFSIELVVCFVVGNNFNCISFINAFANIDFTRKDKEGGEYRAPDCLSVRLRATPRGPVTSSKLLTSLKMAAAVRNYLIQENVPFSQRKYDLRPSLSKVRESEIQHPAEHEVQCFIVQYFLLFF
jgi:hypothetical protein